MYMFGHNYTKRDNEVVRYLYLQGIIVHVIQCSYKCRLVKLCCTSDSSTCCGLAMGDVGFHNSKHLLAKFKNQDKQLLIYTVVVFLENSAYSHTMQEVVDACI